MLTNMDGTSSMTINQPTLDRTILPVLSVVTTTDREVRT